MHRVDEWWIDGNAADPLIERSRLVQPVGRCVADDGREVSSGVAKLVCGEAERRRHCPGLQPHSASSGALVERREVDPVVYTNDVDLSRVPHDDVGETVGEHPMLPCASNPVLPEARDDRRPRRRWAPFSVAVRFVQDSPVWSDDAGGMDQRIDITTVRVDDPDAAARFYVDELCWEPLLAVPGEVAFFQTGPGQVLSLFEAEGFDGEIEDGAGSGPRGGFMFAMNLLDESSVRQAVEELRDAGGRVLKEPQRASFGGFHAYVADPAGICWEIAHNPGWSVSDDGTVRIEPVDPE